LRVSEIAIRHRLATWHASKYMDIGAKFLGAGGNIPADVMGDKLHPATKGYEIWANAVIDPLTKMMAN
jgi:lysophospholipase L1-like esterase